MIAHKLYCECDYLCNLGFKFNQGSETDPSYQRFRTRFHISSGDIQTRYNTLKLMTYFSFKITGCETVMWMMFSTGYYGPIFPHGPLAKYVKLWVAHALGMPGNVFPATSFKGKTLFSPPPWVSDPGMHHGTCVSAVTRVGIANPRWWGKRSRHSRRMCKAQFYVSGKKPVYTLFLDKNNLHIISALKLILLVTFDVMD